MRQAFYFHFNKPATQRAGKPQISVHYADTCYIVDNVICNVPAKGRLSKRQPRFVMAGKLKDLTIKDNIAIIT